jgi:hypothetical protein
VKYGSKIHRCLFLVAREDFINLIVTHFPQNYFIKEVELNNTLNSDRFIDRWSGREGGQERANYSLFLTELCDVIGVAHPSPNKVSALLKDAILKAETEAGNGDIVETSDPRNCQSWPIHGAAGQGCFRCRYPAIRRTLLRE